MMRVLSRWWSVQSLLCLGFALVLPSRRGGVLPGGPGQTPTLGVADTGVADTVDLATITTDTGAFASGWRDFSRYTNPVLCVNAARRMQMLQQRALIVQRVDDPLHARPGQDTVGQARVIAVARTCGARFTLANIEGRLRPVLFELAMLEQNDSLARTIVAAQIAQAPTPEARTAVWRHALKRYLAAEPPRVAAANAMVAQLDTQLVGDTLARVALHEELLAYDREGEDTAGVRREAERLVALISAQLVVHEREYDLLKNVYLTLLSLALFEHPDSLPALVQQERQTLTRFMTLALHLEYVHSWGHKKDDMTVQQVLKSELNGLEPGWLTGSKWDSIPPVHLQADYWFPPPGHTASNTAHPVLGLANLVCIGGFPEVGEQTSDRDGGRFAMAVRRWLAQYGPRGATVTMLAIAADSDGSLDGDFYPTVAQAAQFWRWYYQDYEQLPVTVGVQARPQSWLPAPDGRRVWAGQNVPWDVLWGQLTRTFAPYYAQYHDSQCVLLDRHSKVVAMAGTSAAAELFDIDAFENTFNNITIRLLQSQQPPRAP